MAGLDGGTTGQQDDRILTQSSLRAQRNADKTKAEIGKAESRNREGSEPDWPKQNWDAASPPGMIQGATWVCLLNSIEPELTPEYCAP